MRPDQPTLVEKSRRGEPTEPTDVTRRVCLVGIPGDRSCRRQLGSPIDRLDEALQSENLLVLLRGEADTCQKQASKVSSAESESLGDLVN